MTQFWDAGDHDHKTHAIAIALTGKNQRGLNFSRSGIWLINSFMTLQFCPPIPHLLLESLTASELGQIIPMTHHKNGISWR